ncbi:MAG: hypothetical protein QNK86_04020 [Akkermansiaceae bacterium]
MTFRSLRPILTIIVFSAVTCAVIRLASADNTADKPLQVRVDTKGFNASQADIKKVLDYAGHPLWKQFADYKIEPIVVQKGNGGPITLFKRNNKGEIIIKLDTKNTFWSQYAYQWAHELCHVLCGYRPDGRDNKWFEETLCEMASLYCMRAMAVDWAAKPPYPNWKSYAPSLKKYADTTMAKYEKVDNKGLAAFYKKHEKKLRKDSTLRQLNGAMAAALLPVFEKNPEHWEAVRYINITAAKKGLTLKEYFTKWKKDAPKKHHALIDEIMKVYGVK